MNITSGQMQQLQKEAVRIVKYFCRSFFYLRNVLELKSMSDKEVQLFCIAMQILIHSISQYYIPFHNTTSHFTTLHCISQDYIAFNITTLHSRSIHRISQHYIVFHITALHFTTLHCIILHIMLYFITTFFATSFCTLTFLRQRSVE